MKHYEYLTLKEVISDNMDIFMNTYGKQGWELVTIVTIANNYAILFFKREL